MVCSVCSGLLQVQGTKAVCSKGHDNDYALVCVNCGQVMHRSLHYHAACTTCKIPSTLIDDLIKDEKAIWAADIVKV